MPTSTIIIIVLLFIVFLLLGRSMLRTGSKQDSPITNAEKRRLLGSSVDDVTDVEAENFYSLIGDNTKRH